MKKVQVIMGLLLVSALVAAYIDTSTLSTGFDLQAMVDMIKVNSFL